jgi:hypothetical protein
MEVLLISRAYMQLNFTDFVLSVVSCEQYCLIQEIENVRDECNDIDPISSKNEIRDVLFLYEIREPFFSTKI